MSQAGDFVSSHPDNEITFVGYSKGAPEAEASAIMYNKNAILFNPAPLTLSAEMYNASKSYTSNITEYIVRGDIINSTLNRFASPLSHNNNVVYLPSQHQLSWGQVKNNGLLTSLWNNAIQDHYIESVISALNK